MNKRTIRAIHRKMEAAYQSSEAFAHPNGKPLDVLIQTILSQNTSDHNSFRAYRKLRKDLPRWSLVAESEPEVIADCIREGGLAEIKSNRIKEVLNLIKQKEGRISLACLNKMSDREALSYLLSLPGIGIKTACCVLLFGMNRPVFPVDTHIYRISKRMGWIEDDIKIDDAGAAVRHDIPDELILSLHLLLIEHGRKACKARNPLCDSCCVKGHCKAHKAKRI